MVENDAGDRRRIDCDGVIFSGDVVGGNTPARAGHLSLCSASNLPAGKDSVIHVALGCRP